MDLIAYHQTFDNNTKPKGLVVLLHGYGSNGTDLIAITNELEMYAPGFAYISFDAPHQWEGGTMGNYQWYSLDDKILAKEQMQSSVKSLNKSIANALKKYGLTDKQIIVAGFSQGGMMSLHSVCWLENPPLGIMSFSGFVYNDLFQDPHSCEKTNVLIMHGSEDTIVLPTDLQKAENTMRKTGCRVESHMIKGLAHGIDYRCIKKAGNFMASLNY